MGLGNVHGAWLAKLDAAIPDASISVPDDGALSALLARLGIASEDAAEVLRTMPCAEHEPESWWLLQRSHQRLARGLANRGNDAEPLPPLPAALTLFPVH